MGGKVTAEKVRKRYEKMQPVIKKKIKARNQPLPHPGFAHYVVIRRLYHTVGGLHYVGQEVVIEQMRLKSSFLNMSGYTVLTQNLSQSRPSVSSGFARSYIL